MKADIPDTPEYAAVAEHLRKLHEPAFGRAHALGEPHVTADGARVAVTGLVFDELAGVPRTAIYTCHDGELQPVSATFGEAVAAPTVPGTTEYAHWSPDGRQLLLGVAGLGADLAGGQGSGTTPVEADSEEPGWQPRVGSAMTTATGGACGCTRSRPARCRSCRRRAGIVGRQAGAAPGTSSP